MAPIPLTAARWLRAKTITADALEVPETERSTFVARACADDASLAAEVESLLAASAQAGAFLDAHRLDTSALAGIARAADEATTPVAAGRRVGPYRIQREIGRGGMGVVYLASRDDDAYEKQVAIKVVRGGLTGDPLMQRFREERRILATLDHPNIARLLDGGTTEDGLPYLVMEYVGGTPLDVYARENGLTVRARLALFRDVCAAVQYAHQRLVIHRDLKPRNVLVTPDGTPKLLDFGIARLLEPGLDPEEQTRTGVRALTLEGASPEQVRGETLSVTSDVYALGVILYRLLTGLSPYGAARRTDADLMRAICEDAAPRPSDVSPRDARELRGELDWITLQALRKEPDRRYPSVEQLAEDVQRYLTGRPVAAAPDSWRYRARKFTSRNRTGIAAAVVIALSTAAGLTATLWQARRADAQRARAEARFADVRKLANSFLFEFHDAIRDLPGSTAARRLVAAKALEYLDNLSGEQGRDPELRLELAIAYHRVGEILGAPYSANLGDTAGALRSVQKAIDIEEGLVAGDPGHKKARESLGKSHLLLAQLHAAQLDDAASLESAKRALRAMEALAADYPADAAIRRDLPSYYDMIGDIASNAGDLEEGLRQYRKAGEVIEAILAGAPRDDSALRAQLANQDSIAITLGNPRYPNLDDPEAALAVIEKAVRLSTEMSRASTVAAYRTWFGHVVISLGEIQTALGDHAGAVASLRTAVAAWEALAAADAHDVSRRLYLAFALYELGDALSEAGRLDEATAAVDRAIALTTALARADPDSADVRTYVASARTVYGGILARKGRRAEALRSYDESIGIYRSVVSKNGINLQLRLEMAAACVGAARTVGGDCPRALPYLQCGEENFAQMARHFRLTRKQALEQAEIEAGLRRCAAPRF